MSNNNWRVKNFAVYEDAVHATARSIQDGKEVDWKWNSVLKGHPYLAQRVQEIRQYLADRVHESWMQLKQDAGGQ